MQKTGVIRGKITDSSGEALPGVLLSSLGEEYMLEMDAVSGETGEYRIENLIPDTYRLVATLEGFKSVGINNVVVRQGKDTVENIIMHLEQVE